MTSTTPRVTPHRILWLVLYVIALSFSCTTAYGADFRLSENKYVLFLNGEIKQGDYQKIRQILLKLDALPRTISLNSPGGDIEEAIRIGKLLRRALFQSTISEYGQCDSACFILWASAVRKFPATVWIDQNTKKWEGKLGLHRPYYGRSEYSQLTTVEARNAYQKLEASVREYLVDLKVPTDITESMFRTRSTDADYISDIALIDKLGQEAPYFEEWLIAKCGELPYQEDIDYKLLMAAELMRMSGTPLADTSPGHKRIASMSESYKKYLNDKALKINTCRANAESDETKKVLRELLREKSAGD